MKISFIATVYNEKNSIEDFLESLIQQTRKPDEIVIVDSESSDNTVELIKKSKLKIHLIIKKGNPSFGRNLAIKNTKYEYIAVSDAGCILDKNWLKNIIAPFENDNTIDVVSGFYKPQTHSVFQKSLATYTCVMLDRLNPKNFLPSSRSVAFKKSVWKKVRGYPEELHACEDLIFDKRLKKIDAKFNFVKEAVVYWPQKKNLVESFSQFFEYARGDGNAIYIRPQTPLLYLRYCVGLILLFFSPKLALILIVAYIFWSIKKNYKYVQNSKAYIFLPALQITSDIATILGNIFGLFDKRKYLIPIFIYAIITLVTISYGIPNNNHPFNYNMDEWHQSQSVRAVYSQFTPNVEGAANGSMFHFIFSGLFIAPFVVLKFIDTNLITSSINGIAEQQKIFILLRLNTLFFGVLTLFTIAKIANLLSISKFLSVLLFASVPVWIVLSNIFKYDIALTFWITFSLYMYFRYGKNTTNRNFLLSSIPTALAFATKISALPLVIIYLSSYFIYLPKNKWFANIKTFLFGIILYIFISLFAGIPDIILGVGNLNEYLVSNLAGNIERYSIYNIGFPNWWMYWILRIIPTVFGHAFYLLSLTSIIIVVFTLIKNKVKNLDFKHQLILLIGLFIFFISLILLNLGATGNRLLVLLPFLVLITVKAFSFIQNNKHTKRLSKIILIVVITFQLLSSFILIYARFLPSVNEISSAWLQNNIQKGTVIGIENPPIYQTQPDIVLSEFYQKQDKPNTKTHFEYKTISSRDKNYPSVVLIPQRELHEKYIKTSDRKQLINKLRMSGYKLKTEFHTPEVLNIYFMDELTYNLTGLNFRSDISVFVKD